MPAASLNHVAPERFDDGHWCEATQRQHGEGDIVASYSADRIGMGEPVRKPFRWQGALWVSVGFTGGEDTRRVQAYRLMPRNLFEAPICSYAAIVADGKKARANTNGFYHGMKTTYGGKDYVLCGPPQDFAPAKEAQLDLF